MNNPQSITNQFVKNSFWNVLMVLFSKFGGLVFVILVARFLLPEKFGIYTLAIAMTMLVLAFTNIGTNQTLLRYVSEALGKGDKKRAASYYRFIFKIKVLFTIVSFFLLIILAYPLSSFIFKKPDLFIPLLISTFYLLVLSFQTFYESLFYVFENVKFLTIKEAILQFSKIFFIVLFFLFIGKTVSLTIAALIFSSLIALIILIYYLRQKVGFIFEKKDKLVDKKQVLNFVKYAIFSSVSFTIFAAVDTVLLGLFVTSNFLGHYSAAVFIVIGFTAMISFSKLLLPIFTRMKDKDISNAFNRILRYLSIISIPTIFGIFILGRYLLMIIYGYEYLGAALPLFVLSLLIFETPITENLTALFFAKNKQKFVSRIFFFAIILNIVLSLIFVVYLLRISEVLAITGVAIATVISRMLILFSFIILSKRELGISLDFRVILKPLFAATIMGGGILLINQFITDMNLLIGFFEVFLGIFIYIGLMFLIKGVSKKDFYLVREVIK